MTRQDFLRMAAAGAALPAPAGARDAEPALVPRPKMYKSLGGAFRPSGPLAFNALPGQLSERTIRLALNGGVSLSPAAKMEAPNEGLRLLVEDPGAPQKSAEAYRLAVQEGRVTVGSRSPGGILAGLRTLAQLAAGGPLPQCEIVDWPDISLRAAHVCYHLVRETLAYNTPAFPAVLAHIDELAALKYNAVLLELESLFPYRRHPLVSCKIAFTPVQIEAIRERLDAHRMEIIPLVQCLGHAYNVLMHDEYGDYREIPGSYQQYCPTHPGLPGLYMEFVEEYLEKFPGLRQWHMGGDESRQLGQCPRCRAKVKQHGVSKVYVDYVSEVARRLKARGITPLVWSDMLEQHPENIPDLPKYLKIVYWNYHLPTWPRPYAVNKFRQQGFQVIAAPAVRYGGFSEMSIHYPTALEGIETLIPKAHGDGCAEIMVTNWMKGSPYENSHYGFAYAAELCWSVTGRREEFQQRYARTAFGCDDGSITDVYELLSNKVIPYGEPVLAHQPFNTNRYDQSGFRFAEKWQQYASPDRRPRDSPALFVSFLRQFYRNQKSWEPEVLEQLRTALDRSEKAEGKLSQLAPRCGRGKRQLELLALCATCIQVKARFALALHAGNQLLNTSPDRETMARWLSEWPALSQGWWQAKRRHRAALLVTGFAPCVELLNELIFEPAEHDFFVEMRMRMLKKLDS